MRTAFLTGGTGFLGSHFILNAANTRYDQFIVMVRGVNADIRKHKLKKALTIASDSYAKPYDIEHVLSNCKIIQGDLALDTCGMELLRLSTMIANESFDFWHFAAVLDFDDNQAERVNKLNVDGTNKILSLVHTLKAKRFIYVSTAYSCGAVNGFMKEELHNLDRSFSNVYEKSKCFAEHQVVEYCNTQGIDWTIIRPSIVIGNSQTKKPGGASTGLYNFIRQLSGLSKITKNTDEKIRIFGNPEAVPNIIPIDIAIQEFIAINEDPNSSKNIHHVTSYSSPHVQFFVEEIARQLGSKNTTVETFDTTESSPLENFTAKHISIYASYFKKVQVFENKRKLNCHVNALDTMNYIAEGIRETQEESAFHVFEKQSIPNPETGNLTVYTAGQRSNPAILLINAHGMPVQFMSPLAKKLSKTHFVVTWETRISKKLKQEDIVYNKFHLIDAIAILDFFKFAKVSVLGWCTGAGLATSLSLGHPERVEQLILLNSSLLLKGLVEEDFNYSEFEANMHTLMPKIANNLEFATLMHAVVFKKYNQLQSMNEKELSHSADSLLTAVDPAIMHLTNKPFETPVSLEAHARLILGHIKSFPKNIEQIPHNTLIITGGADKTATNQASSIAARLIKNSSLLKIEHGDHFMLYNSSRFTKHIIEFLTNQQSNSYNLNKPAKNQITV